MKKDLNLLLPDVKKKCVLLIGLCKEKGIEIRVTSTLRTEDEQSAFFAQGRKSLGFVNTLWAEAGLQAINDAENKKTVTDTLSSAHETGRAFDIAVFKDGKPVWSGSEYKTVGELGEGIGLKWGGRFKKKDMCHFEFAPKTINKSAR